MSGLVQNKLKLYVFQNGFHEKSAQTDCSKEMWIPIMKGIKHPNTCLHDGPNNHLNLKDLCVFTIIFFVFCLFNFLQSPNISVPESSPVPQWYQSHILSMLVSNWSIWMGSVHQTIIVWLPNTVVTVPSCEQVWFLNMIKNRKK